jgi:hypothetical protein
MKTCLVSTVLLSCPCLAQDVPKTMTKIEVRLQGPKIPAGSFATKPRVMYRAGSRYCRVQEAEDTEDHIHGLAVTNEPDAWMVNLTTKSGRHIVDPGPTFNCHLPIFADQDAQGLEFGHEMEFFKNKGATIRQGTILQGKETTQYQVEIGGSKLALFTYGIPERPLAVGQVRGGDGEIYWYSGYGEVPLDARLFAKPDGIKFDEVK